VKKLTFQNTRDDLGSYDGETLGWFIIDADGLAAANGSMEFVADLAVAFEIAGAPRGTIDVVIDTVDGDSTTSLLTRDPASAIPLADTTGTTPAMVVFYDTTGGSDATDPLVAALEVPSIEAGYADWEIDPSGGLARITDVAGVHNSFPGRDQAGAHTIASITGLEDALAAAGATVVDLILDEVDASGGSFTDVPFHGLSPVPRAYIGGFGLTFAVLDGADVGSLWTLTPSGPCTVIRELTPGEYVSSRYLGLGVVALSMFGSPDVSRLLVQQTERNALAMDQAEVDRGIAAAVIDDETAPYLRVGHDGAGGSTHDEGAFACDTDLQFPDGFDERIAFRLIRSAGLDTHAELSGRNVDALFGAVDASETSVFQDADGFPRYFGEHIQTGETVEQDPRNITTPENIDNPRLGARHIIRRTIDYTGGPAGVGVEAFWVPSSASDAVATADGVRWRKIHELIHDHPESMRLDYTEPWYLGLSQHQTRIYWFQLFNGIDSDQLVDLHASDATSSTSVTCRLGTGWTAAGSQGLIVNYTAP
jgi:hypothetical protein